MKTMKIMLVLVLVTASGCSGKMVSYSPSIIMEGAGHVKVGEFRYLPNEKGELDNNQVDTGSGYNRLYTETEMKYFVADAVSKELKFIGYKLDPNSSVIISGDIHEYSYYYVGFTTEDVKVKIEFIIINNTIDGRATEIYRKVHEGVYSGSKWTYTGSFNVVKEGLTRCIRSFVEEAQKAKIL